MTERKSKGRPNHRDAFFAAPVFSESGRKGQLWLPTVEANFFTMANRSMRSLSCRFAE